MIQLCGHTMGMPGLDLGRCLALLGGMGFEGIEVRCAQDGQIDPHGWAARMLEPALKQAERAGVRFVCLTPYAKNYLDAAARAAGMALMRRTIEIAADVGAPFVRAYGGQEVPPDLRAAAWAATVQALRELCDHADRRGVRLAVETHIGTLTFTAGQAAAMVAEVSRPTIGVLLDYAWVHYAGQETIAQALEVIGSRLCYIHAKDHHVVDRSKGVRRSTLLGEGEVPWAGALAAIRAAGYAGFVCDEYEKYWSADLPAPEVGMAHNLRYLRQHLGQAGSAGN
jgi:sugar phosphate isomerase/epimerase